MTFEDFENIFTLFCTIVGLLYCLFKYIERPKRRYLFLVVFFLGHFFSDYYWGIFVLTMHTYPTVSEFMAYLGWNFAYIFLFLAIFQFRKESKKYFHPLMLWPLLTNIPLFILYIQFGGYLNNIWQVGATTLIMIFCMRELLFYVKHRKDGVRFPLLPMAALLFEIMEYGMWTASCFEWKSELLNPYLYCTVLGSVIMVGFGWAAAKDFEAEGVPRIEKNEAALRFQILIQTIISFFIVGACVGGYLVAARMRNNMVEAGTVESQTDDIAIVLFAISAVLILLVIFILYEITVRYRLAKLHNLKMDAGMLSRVNFVFTVFITLALMVFAVVYNTRMLYKSSVTGVYEDGEDKVKMFATDLENYLTLSGTTLRVAADTVNLMDEAGTSSDVIEHYIIDQTGNVSKQFDENFTGLYAYVNGEYLDGLEWVPPEGYDPKERDWYKAAVDANGEVVIVSPYVDAQTGSVVITFAKCISGKEENGYNVVALDVIVNHIQEVTAGIDVAGRGYGMVVNEDGFIVAHNDESFNGQYLQDFYGKELLNEIVKTKEGIIRYEMDDDSCTLFVCPIMEQWYAVVVVDNSELFTDVHSQLAVNIMIFLVAFLLISFFYYLGYKNERDFSRKVEAMNIQVVSALAAAIDAKDPYTNGHSSRVAKYSRMIAKRAGYSESRQDEIYMMGLLHDVGKIGVPDEVLNYPGKLSAEDFEKIKKHPMIGYNILQSIKERSGLSIGARWHHERYAGGGYPDGIAGEEIPEEARIIAVADAYDAMSSKRNYRDLMPQAKVREEIEKGCGTQFDPRFAKIMLQMMDEDPEYTMIGKESGNSYGEK